MQRLCPDNEAEFGRIWDRTINLSSGVADIVAEQLANLLRPVVVSLILPLLLFSSLFLTAGFLWRHFVRSSADRLFLHFYADSLRFSAELQ